MIIKYLPKIPVLFILRSTHKILKGVEFILKSIKGTKLTDQQVEQIINSSKNDLGDLLQDSKYVKLAEPIEGEWLYKNYQEQGQTVEQYIQNSYNYVSDSKKKIYIMPILDHSIKSDININKIIEYISVFFQLETVLLDKIDINYLKHKYKNSKINLSKLIKDNQYDTNTIMQILQYELPTDAFCLLGITNVDLYSKGCNFVFGEAAYYSRIGVTSYCRFDSTFYEKYLSEDDLPEDEKDEFNKIFDNDILINRIFKLVTHEILHMFSMEHCIWYNCNLCGISGIIELDKYTHQLCPICINKLYIANKFDVNKRTIELNNFYQQNNISIKPDYLLSEV